MMAEYTKDNAREELVKAGRWSRVDALAHELGAKG